TYFGWSCMSWRHPEATIDAAITRKTAENAEHAEKKFSAVSARSAVMTVITCRSVRNGRHLSRLQRFQEPARLLEIELRIAGLDAEEEAVAAGEREPGHVEHRVIGHRQPVQREHAEDGRQGRGENRALECDRDEHRPAVVRLAADVDR